MIGILSLVRICFRNTTLGKSYLILSLSIVIQGAHEVNTDILTQELRCRKKCSFIYSEQQWNRCGECSMGLGSWFLLSGWDWHYASGKVEWQQLGYWPMLESTEPQSTRVTITRAWLSPFFFISCHLKEGSTVNQLLPW